jgi:excisionase family DNA binding protein
MEATMSETPALALAVLESLDERSLDILAEKLAPLLAARLGTREQASPWLNAEDAARYLACSRDRLYDLVQVEKLQPSRDGRRLLFNRTHLDAYLGGSG